MRIDGGGQPLDLTPIDLDPPGLEDIAEAVQDPLGAATRAGSSLLDSVAGAGIQGRVADAIGAADTGIGAARDRLFGWLASGGEAISQVTPHLEAVSGLVRAGLGEGGLSQLTGLIDQARGAGLDLSVAGQLGDLIGARGAAEQALEASGGLKSLFGGLPKLPDLDLPSIDLPDLDLPDLSLPSPGEVLDDLGDTLGGVRDRIEDTIGDARDTIDGVIDRGGEAIDDLRERAGGLLDRARTVADGIGDFAGDVIDALNPFESPSQALQNLDSDGDSFNVKLGGELSLAPHLVEGLAGAGITLKGDVSAQVKRVGDPPTYELEVAGSAAALVTGEAGVDPIADAEVKAGPVGSAKLKFTFDSLEEAQAAVAGLEVGRLPEALESIELRGGLAAEIGESVGLPWALGESLGAGVQQDLGVRLELNPPAVAVLGELKGNITGAAAAGLHVGGQVEGSVSLEGKVSLPQGTTVADVLNDPGAALSSIDRDALSVSAAYKLRGEAGVGPLGKLFGAGGEVEIKAEGRPGDLVTAAERLFQGDLPGVVNAFGEDNQVSARIDAFYQKGPRFNPSLEIEGVGGGLAFEWYREDHATLLNESVNARQLLDLLGPAGLAGRALSGIIPG